jgi:lysophospholipase L1-like esterase
VRSFASISLAVAAALAACAAPAAKQPLAPISAEAPFRDEVMRFAEIDRESPPPECPILFVGSSSIRMWQTLSLDMAPWPVLNRGFGGSTIADVNFYFDRVVAPYRPRAIVFYAGENDLDSGQSPAAVAEQFRSFMERKRARFGALPVFYISAKPSKARFRQFARQSDLNAQIRSIARERRDLVFVDVVPAMMANGRPRDLFVEDGLHMSPAGYAIWRDVVRRALSERGIAQRQRCRGL